MSNRAWVTLATNDSYGLGALVLAHSLRRVSSVYPAVVLITPSVTEAMRERLRAVFAEVIIVDVLDSQDAAHLALLQRPELGITFTKIHCWNLTQYEKCVFLDADTLVVQNSDELFDREELSAAPDVGWPDCFNSGVFVFSPSAETFSRLITFAQERGSFDGGDQGLLNSFFSGWARGDINTHLPFLYNVTSAAFYSYLPALKHFGQNMKIIHFIGAAKPWLQHFNFESHTVDAPDHIRGLLQLWWDLFVSQVHTNLDTSMVEEDEPEPPPAQPPQDASQRLHYKPVLDPESEFPWHRPDAQISEDLPERRIDMTDVHDPWEIYRGHIPPITEEQSAQHAEAADEIEEIRKYAWEYQQQDRASPPNVNDQYQQQEQYVPPQSTHHEHHRHHDSYQHHRPQPQSKNNQHSEQHRQSDYSHSQQSLHMSHHGQSNDHHQHWHHGAQDISQQGHQHHHEDKHEQYHHHQQSLPDYHEQSSQSYDDHSQVHGKSQSHSNHNQREPECPRGDEANKQHHGHSHQVHHAHKHSDTHTHAHEVEVLHIHLQPERKRNRRPRRLRIDVEINGLMNGDVSETESETFEEIIPRHPYDGFYLRHKATIDARGRKMCTHEIPPTPSPSPSPPGSPTSEEYETAEENELCDDGDQSGVAGNLARVVPGASSYEALDDLSRRQGWEAGNIDYMGADSFDKIWAKISQTLSAPRTSPPKQPPPPKEPSPPATEEIKIQEAKVVNEPVSEPVEVAKEAVAVEAPAPASPVESPALATPVETPAPVKALAPVEAPVVIEPVVPKESTVQVEAPVVKEPVVPKEATVQVAAPVAAPIAVPTPAKIVAPAEIPAPVPVEVADPTEVPVSVVAAAAEPKEKTEVAAVAPPKKAVEEAPEAVKALASPAPASQAPLQGTPPKASEAPSATDSPPLAHTPSKEEVPAAPAARSEERRKPAGKLQLRPPLAADPLPTPDSEAEDAAALAHAIIASELRTPTVDAPSTPAAPASPPTSLDKGLTVEEPQVPTPPVGGVSLAQIGVKPKSTTTAARIESSLSAAAAAPADPPKKKLVKKVVKKDAAGGEASAAAPVPPPRKKEKKPKEK